MKNQIRKILLFLFIGFVSVSSYCQGNLVPNPSFEIYDTCPNDQGQLINYATGWNVVNQPSPDYFNSCNPCTTTSAGCFSVPYNWGGWQPAATGVAYAGLYTMEDTPPYNNREYIGIQLSTPMNIGTKYFVSFKANLSLTSSADFNTATDKLGILFSTILYSTTSPVPINNFAHIYTATIITDTTNWTIIKGSIIADSAYQYAIIGNFFDDANTNFTRLLFDANILGAYYFIDDVCVSTDSTTCNNLNFIGEEFLINKINIYPNPASTFITIEIKPQINQFSEIIFFDILGREVKKMQTKETIISIPTSDLNYGIYFIQIKAGNKHFTNKLIIN